MTEIVHSLECKAWMERLAGDRQAFLEKWPQVCTSCGGVGGHTVSNGWEAPPDFAPCEDCAGQCPRCGFGFGTDEYDSFVNGTVCPNCAFDWAAVTEVLPPDLSEFNSCLCGADCAVEMRLAH